MKDKNNQDKFNNFSKKTTKIKPKVSIVNTCKSCKIIRKVRIVGGNKSDPGQYPWLATLMVDNKHFCGASIISDKHLLTAAHCLSGKSPSKVIARLGAHEVPQKYEDFSKNFKIKKFLVHNSYNPTNFENDIAIIKLKTRIEFSKIIMPINIPIMGDMDFSGRVAHIVGWGKDNTNGWPRVSPEPQHTELIVWKYEKCKNIYKQARFTENMMCASDHNGTKDSCQGDSGGPLMLQDKYGDWTLIGIISWGYGCALKDYPGVYTRVSKYIQWINTNIN